MVCDCYRGGWKCDQNCLEESLIEESLFYSIGTVRGMPVACVVARGAGVADLTARRTQNLYNNLTYMYPESDIWVIGHSLGGALASMLGVTFGVPVVAIESPGEKMAARRLHLPTPVRPHNSTLQAD